MSQSLSPHPVSPCWVGEMLELVAGASDGHSMLPQDQVQRRVAAKSILEVCHLLGYGVDSGSYFSLLEVFPATWAS